jgi:hypothetical protein
VSARAGLVVLAAALLAACSVDGPAPRDPGTGPVACGPRDCLLPRPAGARVQNEGDAPQFLDRATGARLTVERLDLGNDADVLAALLDREAADLGLVARFEQPPQGPAGIVVRGVSGQRAPAPGQLLDPDPVRVRLVTFTNPATGHVLVLRIEGPVSAFEHPDFSLDAVIDGALVGPRF